MVTKYIIEMDHSTALGTELAYFYEGQNKKGESLFHHNKAKAKRYLLEHEAIRDMSVLRAMHPYADNFRIMSINCRA